MFTLAILIGIYSYLVFGLGLLGLVDKPVILATTTFYIITILFFKKNSVREWIAKLKFSRNQLFKSKLLLILMVLIIVQSFVNLIGALGPELAFDALWYHLTIPKIYLVDHRISFIPGNLLYYSAMPKLTEMFYLVGLLLKDEIIAKFTHFLFGILCLISIYKLSRKFFSTELSLLAAVVFSSNLVFNWQSITAYVDLARTFFEIMVLWAFVNWWEKRERKWLIESAIMVGLAISVKLLSLASFIIFTLLIVYRYLRLRQTRLDALVMIKDILVYWYIGIFVALPWFVFSFINTGNPVYPFFTNLYQAHFDLSLVNPGRFFIETLKIFTKAPDLLSPLYLILFPLIILTFTQFKRELKMIGVYSLLALIIWYLTPMTGGGRFILSYLPALSIMIVAAIEKLEKDNLLKNSFLILICVTSLSSIIYRGVANARYLPVILVQQTKHEFLAKNLNFSFGDFYDTDDYFKANIKRFDRVLLYGFHNLYYIDFPFIDSSWAKKGDVFNYIAVQNSELPERFNYWNLIYQNPKTNVKLYSTGGQRWIY